jgi:hypothetical protein
MMSPWVVVTGASGGGYHARWATCWLPRHRRMDFPHSTGLSDAFRVIAFAYVGHVMRIPKPQTLAPAHIIAAVLAWLTRHRPSAAPTLGSPGSP